MRTYIIIYTFTVYLRSAVVIKDLHGLSHVSGKNNTPFNGTNNLHLSKLQHIQAILTVN